MVLKTLVTHELPPKWNENEKVLHHPEGDIMLLPSIKPKKSYEINDLVSAFSNTLDALPQEKKIQELYARISTQDYLRATFYSTNIVDK